MNQEQMEAQKAKIAALIREKTYKAMTASELAYLMQVPPQERDLFDSLINALLADGQAVLTPKKKLMPPEHLSLTRGVFSGTERGFGFVAHENGADVFIPASATNGARHKDIVLFRLSAEAEDGQRAEGEIVRVLSRGVTTCVGTFMENEVEEDYVIPDERRLPREIRIGYKDDGGAVAGHKVVVRLTKEIDGAQYGAVTQILGHRNDPGVDILSIVEEHGIPSAFAPKTMKAAETMPDNVSDEDLEGRADFRDDLVITIDGADAKDLDDAISLKPLPNGNVQLDVHIADVSHYVRPHSALDEEALQRGTSVYLVDRVIPMLPHALSNGICSLHPDCDRLTLSCSMEIDGAGHVVSHVIVPSVIHSKRRMTYDEVNDFITGGAKPADWPDALADMLQGLAGLSRILREKREKRNAISFDLKECHITIDENGKAIDVQARTRNDATGLIEECILVCNETVAEAFFWLELPFVYRTHEAPDEEKMDNLALLATRFGHRMKGKHNGAKAVQSLLESAKGTPESLLLTRMALRSMKQARYTADCAGHFGLAAKYYCHFTSPIRRYPDLLIHRIIKSHLCGELTDSAVASLRERLPNTCVQCSTTERRAEAAERDVDALKKAEYMANHIDEIYDGIISGVTSWGVFVELPNTVDGLIPIAELPPDSYVFDESLMRLAGQNTGQVFGIGDALTVRVARADTDTRKVEFSLAAAE